MVKQRVTVLATPDAKVERYDLLVSDEKGRQTALKVRNDIAELDLPSPGTYVLVGVTMGSPGAVLEMQVKTGDRILVEKATATIPKGEAGGAGAVTFRLGE